MQTFLIGVVAIAIVCKLLSTLATVQSLTCGFYTILDSLHACLLSGLQGRVSDQVWTHHAQSVGPRARCNHRGYLCYPSTSVQTPDVGWLVSPTCRTRTIHNARSCGQPRACCWIQHRHGTRDRVSVVSDYRQNVQPIGSRFLYSTAPFPVQAPLPVSENAHALAFLMFMRSFAGVRARCHRCPRPQL